MSESGVHRPHVAGIHGRSNDGAYSLVLAGGYEDDIVSGFQFFYAQNQTSFNFVKTKAWPLLLFTLYTKHLPIYFLQKQMRQGKSAVICANLSHRIIQTQFNILVSAFDPTVQTFQGLCCQLFTSSRSCVSLSCSGV